MCHSRPGPCTCWQVARLDAQASGRNCYGAPEKHIPLLAVERSPGTNVLSKVVLTVPHVMDGHKPHFIEYLCARPVPAGPAHAFRHEHWSARRPPALTRLCVLSQVAQGRNQWRRSCSQGVHSVRRRAAQHERFDLEGPPRRAHALLQRARALGGQGVHHGVTASSPA